MKDIVAREEYAGSDGEQKVSWNKIGILIDKNDKQYIKLSMFPGTLFSVFDQKKKEADQTNDGVPF